MDSVVWKNGLTRKPRSPVWYAVCALAQTFVNIIKIKKPARKEHSGIFDGMCTLHAPRILCQTSMFFNCANKFRINAELK